MCVSGDKKIRSILERTIFPVFLSALVVIFIAGICEVLLRVAGVGKDRDPVIEKEIEGIRFYIPNKDFYQQFFSIPIHDFVNWDDLDFYVPRNKSPNSVRIFVFGESAMYGLESSARQLEVMLKRQFPWIKWEIYNFSCPGVNSHILCELAKSARKLSPDIFIIYMGNNESIGPYGDNSLLGRVWFLRKNRVIRAHIFLKGLRLVQLFERVPSPEWRKYLPDDMSKYIPGQAQQQITLRLFENNLYQILRTGVDSGAGVIVGTLSYNRLYGKNKNLEIPKFEQTPMNTIIKKLAKDFENQGRKIYLADIDWVLALNSPVGVPDYSFFCDNIHFTFEGNYLVAREWFNCVVKVLYEKGVLGFPKKTVPIPIEECSRYLGWGKANELELVRLQKGVIRDTVSLSLLEERERRLSAVVKDKAMDEIISNYSIAYHLNRGDEKVAKQYIDYLLKARKDDKALAVSLELYRSMPHSRLAMRLLGNAYANLGDFANAERMYRQCLKYYPDDGLAKDSLELILKLN